ncbi:MAG: GNAT family N-acetyltransferase [Pseudomonadota bacterium]
MPAALVIRPATLDDLPRLHAVVERAYRGDAARAGWTHEADLIPEGSRTDLETLAGIVADPAARLLIALDGDTPTGCVTVTDTGNGLAYLGLLCVDPELQAGGLGKRLVEAAEQTARDAFAARHMEMTVIEQRTELIAFYERRGYTVSGERRDFPIPMTPPLFMTVLVKPLA